MKVRQAQGKLPNYKDGVTTADTTAGIMPGTTTGTTAGTTVGTMQGTIQDTMQDTTRDITVVIMPGTPATTNICTEEPRALQIMSTTIFIIWRIMWMGRAATLEGSTITTKTSISEQK